MKKNGIIISAAVVGLLVCGVAFAKVSTSSTSTKAVGLCQVIVTNLNKRITNFDKNKSGQVTKFKKTQTKVVTLVDNLEAKGYDVTQIRADLVTYDQLITKFNADYSTFVADLGSTRDFTCGKSSGEFMAKLSISRSQLKTIRDDAVAVRTYWSGTLKPAIDALKATTPTVPTTVPTTTVEGGSI
jgi:hypothetical protein